MFMWAVSDFLHVATAPNAMALESIYTFHDLLLDCIILVAMVMDFEDNSSTG